MLDPIEMDRGSASSSSFGSRYDRLTGGSLKQSSTCHRFFRLCRSQGTFSCSLLFSLFILMSLVAVTRVQNSLEPTESGFGCDVNMTLPHMPNRVVSEKFCRSHKPIVPEPNLRDPLDDVVSAPLDTTVRFLVVGDWGRDGFCCQRDVAMEMARAAARMKPQFIANAGDSFYEAGLESSKEEQIQTSWAGIYLEHSPLKNLPWYSVLGNHEYRGSVPAVLNMAKENELFVMPDRYYSKQFTSSDGKLNVDMWFLDTSPMLEAYHNSLYDDKVDTMLNQPDGIKTQWSRVPEQLKWLESGLNKSTADVKIVMGHHPPYTSGAHYFEDNSYLRNNIVPIVEKYDVAVYLSGHDHNLQEYYRSPDETRFIVSAAGSKVEGAFTRADVNLRWFDQINGFVIVEVAKDNIRISFIDYVGQVKNMSNKKNVPKS